jgi:hypothetical protein
VLVAQASVKHVMDSLNPTVIRVLPQCSSINKQNRVSSAMIIAKYAQVPRIKNVLFVSRETFTSKTRAQWIVPSLLGFILITPTNNATDATKIAKPVADLPFQIVSLADKVILVQESAKIALSAASPASAQQPASAQAVYKDNFYGVRHAWNSVQRRHI